MQTNKIERVLGVMDALPLDCEFNQQIAAQLRQTFETFAYRPIDVPIIEHTDLYLRKSGEEIIDRLYDFVYRNRRLCLRPEMTASVMRAHIDHFLSTPLPIRLHYAGPVFRYEKPQADRYRQFTQIGIELIGAAGAMADAEVIRVACQGLEQLGITKNQIVIGHIGVLNRFLDNLDLESRLRSLILSHITVLQEEQGKQQVKALLAELYPDFLVKSTEDSPDAEDSTLGRSLNPKRLIHLFRGMNNEDAKNALLNLLESLNIGLDGNREPDEIAERLLTKLKRQDQTPQIGLALDFISELTQLKGEPAAVLAEGRQVLAHYGIDETPLNDLQAIADTLQCYNLDPNCICLNLGLSRGLQYYTGMVFEVHHNSLDGNSSGDNQLCGGGRYDDLVGVLGGPKDTPATGFAYGLERLRLALVQKGIRLVPQHSSVDALIICAHPDARKNAIQIAETLRQQGIRTALDVCGKALPDNLQDAEQQSIPFGLVVGLADCSTSQVLLKQIHSQQQQFLSIHEAADHIRHYQEHHG
jgi:histidyl-tRNA synthetase